MGETQELPLYKSREQVQALKVSGSSPTSDNFGMPWNLTFEQPGQESIEVDHTFMQVFQPKPGGYYVLRDGIPPYYMPEEEFEKLYVKKE